MILKTAFIRMALLSLALLPMTGCFSEDYSFCPPEVNGDNVRLDFRLFSGEAFKDKVTSVHVSLFDGEGSYIRTEVIGRESIAEYEGMAVTLAPGDYRMVFWANMNGNTIVNGLGTTAHASLRVTYSQLVGTPPVTSGGDILYYAPCGTTRAEPPRDYYSLTVPKGGSYTDVVYFTHAHRSLEVYIKGLSGNSDALPTVEITGLPAGLKYFGMKSLVSNPLKVAASKRTSLVEQDNIVYSAAMFDTFFFGDMEGIEIVIKNSDGAEIYRIPLSDAIEQSNADPTAIIIRLVLSFMNGNVDVSMPGWSSGETGIDF